MAFFGNFWVDSDVFTFITRFTKHVESSQVWEKLIYLQHFKPNAKTYKANHHTLVLRIKHGKRKEYLTFHNWYKKCAIPMIIVDNT